MMSVVMPTRRDFENHNKLVAYLAAQLKQGKIAMLLGAGISSEFGLPGWDELVQRLFVAASEPLRPDLPPEAAVEFLRVKHYKSRTPDFLQLVHNELYKGVNADFSTLRKSELLEAVAALMMSSRRGSAAICVTFNFDDLLERYLEYHGFIVHSIWRDSHWDAASDVTIYHPHGLLPFDVSVRERSDDIVFDFQSYSKVVGNINNAFHQIMFSIARRKTCLFIGLSGRDVNLDVIVGKAGEVHPSKQDNTAFWGVAFGKADEPTKLRWEERGVFYKEVTDWNEVPLFLFEICQAAARI